MATKTFNPPAPETDKKWSTADNWGGSVPVSGDTIVCAASVECEFDVDMSGFAAGLNMTAWQGILRVSLTPGAYYLKLNSDMAQDAAQIIASDGAGGDLPAGVSFTIDFSAGGHSIDGIGLVELRAPNPTNPVCYLSGAEAAGQIVLSVDMDLTADPLWTAGAEVLICEKGTYNEIEVRTLAAVGADTITVTVGLSAAKLLGASVFLKTRAIRLINSTDYFFKNGENWTISSEIVGVYGFSYGAGHALGGLCYCSNRSLFHPQEFAVSAALIGGSYGSLYGKGSVFSGYICNQQYGLIYTAACRLSGQIGSCQVGVSNCAAAFLTGQINNCGIGCAQTGFVIGELSMTANTLNITECVFENDSLTIAAGTEFDDYSELGGLAYSAVERYAGTTGNRKAWSAGGIVITQSTIHPPAQTTAYLHTPESADYYSRNEDKFTVDPGRTLKIKCYGYWSNILLALGAKFELVDPADDPLLGGTALDVFTPTLTKSVWQSDYLEWTNSAAYPKQVVLRRGALGTGGLFYENFEVIEAKSSSGFIKRVGQRALM